MDFIQNMKTETQTLIILILGLDSIISLIGLFLIIAFINYDVNIVLSLITMVNTPVAMLGGFLTGKTMNEVEGETLRKQIIEEYNMQKDMEETSEECGFRENEDEGA